MGDRYTIAERLDSGGMAEVFRGVAESIAGFKKSVAIKRILPELTKNPKFVAMFLDEAKLSLYLQHANIVQVFDIGQADDSYFLVMEYVNGANLKQVLERLNHRNRRITVQQSIYIMLECCKALNYAHGLENPETGEPLSIVHRDISPPNILLSKMGEVKLVDFGLAKANSQIERTDAGVVKGKFSYLSPEAASGRVVDHRADLFAVGILLWEMLTNRRLFFGDTDYQTVELVRQASIPSIQALNSDVEPELEEIVRKALAREPDDRFQEAADLGDSLAQYLFSRRLKVTARDIASLVRDAAQQEERRRSDAAPKSALIDALIQDEMGKLTSLVDAEDERALSGFGSFSLNPNEFMDTSAWASDLDVSNGSKDVAVIHSPAKPTPSKGDANDFSLSQMLEPDRTGVHKASPSGSKGITIALIIAILLLAAIGAGAFIFKDRLFGGSEAGQSDGK